jgi:hypothetical protein
MTRTCAALLLVLLFAAPPAMAIGDGTVRLKPGPCDGEVRGTVLRSPLRRDGFSISFLPEGVDLVGRCSVVGSGAERSLVILWLAMETDITLRPGNTGGAPFGMSVVPADCDGESCMPPLPSIEVPVHLRQSTPRLWGGGAT